MPQDLSSAPVSGHLTFDGPVPGVPGAVVREVAELPAHLPNGTPVGPYTSAAPGGLLFEVPNIARYLIRSGTSIEVALLTADADRGAARLFLYGSARGFLILQRGELPLVAATLMSPERQCVAICGPSGYGKSTLAAELCRRGWSLMADDITRVSWNGMAAIAWPSSTKLKLWRDACVRLGLKFSEVERARQGLETYYAPVQHSTVPTVLNAAIRLRMGTSVGIAKFPPSESAAVLSDSVFRSRVIDALGQRANYARVLAQVARVCRPLGIDGARNCPIENIADAVSQVIR
jgi:hypothetical protein